MKDENVGKMIFYGHPYDGTQIYGVIIEKIDLIYKIYWFNYKKDDWLFWSIDNFNDALKKRWARILG